MKIGVLIPTYNRREHLVQALDSALRQTYRDIEVLVIDDASTDGTANAVAGFSDRRLRYIRNAQNAGLIANINNGMPMFSHEVHWCMVLCDDDFLDRNCIANLVRTLQATQAKSIIHAHRIFTEPGGKITREAQLAPPEETAVDYIRMRSSAQRETYLTGVLFSRTAFREINGYPPFLSGLAADDAFIFALSLKDKLFFDKTAIVYIKIHEEAESRLRSDGMKKLRALRQFGTYCKNVASESGALDVKQFKVFEKTLQRYIRTLSAFWWLRTSDFALAQGDKTHKQLRELFLFVQENPDLFTFRIKFDVVCQKVTGIFPEQYAGYRAGWEKGIRFFQKHNYPMENDGRHHPRKEPDE